MRVLVFVLGLILPLLACAESGTAPAPEKAAAPAKTFEAGTHYRIIEGSAKPEAGKTVDVFEVFWYGCGHCYKFESVIQLWKKHIPAHVNFVASPAMWRQRRPGLPSDLMWTHAKLFYAATATESLDKLHPVFFDAMHKHNKDLIDPKEIALVVNQAGLDGDNFVAVMDSFAVNSQVQLADARQKTFKITGTPEMIVAGRYHVSASKAGGQKQMLEVVDYLVNKVYTGK